MVVCTEPRSRDAVRETVREAIESLADFIKDCDDYKDNPKGYSIEITPELYLALKEEVGHDVKTVRGIRIMEYDSLSPIPIEETEDPD